MTIVGLDTLGLMLLVVAIAIMLTYILWIGWNFEFSKRQFGFLILASALKLTSSMARATSAMPSTVTFPSTGS